MSNSHLAPTLALSALLAVVATFVVSNSAQAQNADFGPYYVMLGGTKHLGESSGFKDSWGFNARVGARETDWFGYEMHYEYIAEFGGATTGTRRTFDRLQIHSLMPTFRLRQNLGYIEPYALGGVGLIIGDVSTPLNRKRRDIGLGFRAGGGVVTSFDFPVNLFAEYSRVFATGRISKYDYSSLAFGLEGRF